MGSERDGSVHEGVGGDARAGLHHDLTLRLGEDFGFLRDETAWIELDGLEGAQPCVHLLLPSLGPRANLRFGGEVEIGHERHAALVLRA